MGSKAKAIAALLAVTCVCSIIALILSVVNVKDVLLSPSTKYGLVFDAGSTHTSLYIYRWPADKENDTGIVSQVEACSVSAPAGLTGRAQHFSLPGSGVCSASPGMPTALLLWLERKRLQRPGCVAMPQLLPPGRTAPSTEQGWTWQGPGISSYADDPVGAGASLKPCLDRAMKIVPAEQQRETPTYLGATAGMRLLREENSTKAEQVLAEVSKAIGEYPVDFRGARILTGSEEGSFGWITVNYLLETLVKLSLALCSRVPTHRWILGSQGYTWQQDQPPGDRVPFSLIKVSGCQQMCGSQEAAAQCSVEVSFSFAEKWEHPQDTEVLGALDLGGASTQITFQPGVPVEDRNTSVFFQLYGTNYSLYSHSYLCYGQSQALKMLLAALHQASSSAQISHPCYPQGYQENITVAELYDSPCVRAPSSASPGLVLMVMGTGDPAACGTAVQRLFNFSCGAQGPCGFNGVYQPPVRGRFFAFAGFYYTFNFLNLTRQQSLSEVNTTVLSFCRRNWAELVQSFPRHLKYLHTYCSVAFYILTLLLDGYKFNEHTWSNIHFSRQAANTDIGWTLGFMLNLTNMFPAEALQRVKGHQPGLWAGAVSLLVLAIVAGLVAVFLHCSWKTK
ncbi:ectonucleoside triphosphate diphosphohydrolase 8-like isoform X2 [Vidua chalybeata]|nr:ectonucleoside triphosphate diphosphohydrolase 8-like isoform X2 [Vidua chalybeata]XP_053817787.1 ectonucleoside triphosphate diphosphohydrolase 8-like isoform X2 [Vidua chalybeata]XP_053817788.1 ectonucleoside triphosphate diphosphohydrolase 8-like isoform X2 [Vidua chalybeata]XP_053817792.1 ectonucleoside triphosphate diphosphohydrolase 8-like isoform X2 [Vidua chalybeata]